MSCLKSAENQANGNPMSKDFLARPGRAKGKCRNMSCPTADALSRSLPFVSPVCGGSVNATQGTHVHISKALASDAEWQIIYMLCVRACKKRIGGAGLPAQGKAQSLAEHLSQCGTAPKAWVHTKEKPLEIRWIIGIRGSIFA